MLNDYFSDFERKELKRKIEQLKTEKVFETIQSIDKAIRNMDAAITTSASAAT